MIIAVRQGYIKKTDNTLSDQKKFTIVNLKGDTLVCDVNHKNSQKNSMTDKTRKSLKPVGCRPGVMYCLRKVHKANKENGPAF